MTDQPNSQSWRIDFLCYWGLMAAYNISQYNICLLWLFRWWLYIDILLQGVPIFLSDHCILWQKWMKWSNIISNRSINVLTDTCSSGLPWETVLLSVWRVSDPRRLCCRGMMMCMAAGHSLPPPAHIHPVKAKHKSKHTTIALTDLKSW